MVEPTLIPGGQPRIIAEIEKTDTPGRPEFTIITKLHTGERKSKEPITITASRPVIFTVQGQTSTSPQTRLKEVTDDRGELVVEVQFRLNTTIVVNAGSTRQPFPNMAGSQNITIRRHQITEEEMEIAIAQGKTIGELMDEMRKRGADDYKQR